MIRGCLTRHDIVYYILDTPWLLLPSLDWKTLRRAGVLLGPELLWCKALIECSCWLAFLVGFSWSGYSHSIFCAQCVTSLIVLRQHISMQLVVNPVLTIRELILRYLCFHIHGSIYSFLTSRIWSITIIFFDFTLTYHTLASCELISPHNC